jgi:uncharacterized protein (DUF2236 family)
MFEALRTTVADSVRSQLAAPDTSLDPLRMPIGDRGWFGPGSMTWRVHGDIPSMLVGGVSALLLQMLHPRAMAGVYDHSAFRTDPLGRLQRTARFVSVTTFGPVEEAEKAVAAVHRVHRRVVGTTPEGERYSAHDPDLIEWIHVAEMASFVAAYQRFSMTPLSDRQVDAYFDETAVVGEAMGASDVPRSAREVRLYFREIRPQLRFGSQAAEARDFVLTPPSQGGLAGLARSAAFGLIGAAAVGTLPGWARSMLGLGKPLGSDLLLDAAVVRPAAFGLLSFLRWTIGMPVGLEVARRRVTGREAIELDTVR